MEKGAVSGLRVSGEQGAVGGGEGRREKGEGWRLAGGNACVTCSLLTAYSSARPGLSVYIREIRG